MTCALTDASLPGTASTAPALAAGLFAAVLLSSSPAQAGVKFEKAIVKKVREDLHHM